MTTDLVQIVQVVASTVIVLVFLWVGRPPRA